MRNYLLLICVLCCCYASAQTLNPNRYSLVEILHNAQLNSISGKLAESVAQNSKNQYSNYLTTLKPQLTLSGNIADFSRDFFGVRQPDGTLIFQPRTQNYSNIGIGISQPITFTGGFITLNTGLTRFDDFDRKLKQYNSVPVSFRLEQPLFSLNEYKWQKKTEPLKNIQAERKYISDLDNIMLESTRYFFDLLDAQIDNDLAKKNLENQLIIQDIERKRLPLGTTTLDKILQIQLQVLKSKQSLASAAVNMKASFFSLRSYVGIKDTTYFQLTLPDTPPNVNITTQEAIAFAKKNNPNFIENSIKIISAEKERQSARLNRFKAKLNFAYGLNGTSSSFNSAYTRPNNQQNFNIGLDIPIIDWGRSKEKINLANSNLKIVKYTVEQNERDIFQKINDLVENLGLLHDNIDISKEADGIAQERFNLANNQLKYGKMSLSDYIVVLNEKDYSKKAYLSSLRAFWETYYQLKQITAFKDLDM